MPYQFFKQGSCSHSATHETMCVLYKHVCSLCFTSASKTFPHTELECRIKRKNASKNEKAMAGVILVLVPTDPDMSSPLIRINATLGLNWRLLKPPGGIGLEVIRLFLQPLIIGRIYR